MCTKFTDALRLGIKGLKISCNPDLVHIVKKLLLARRIGDISRNILCKNLLGYASFLRMSQIGGSYYVLLFLNNL